MRCFAPGSRFLAVFVLAVVLTQPGWVQAQTPGDEQEDSSGGEIRYLGVGPRLGFSVDPDQIVFGAQADFAGFYKDLLFMPLAELGLGDNITSLYIELDALYLFPAVDFPADLMAGVGVALAHYSWDTPAGFQGDDSEMEGGIEIIGAMGFDGPAETKPRLELKLGVGDLPDFKIMVSLRL